MAKLQLTHYISGSSTWRRVPGTKEDVARELATALAEGRWPIYRFEGRQEVVLNPACVMWVGDD